MTLLDRPTKTTPVATRVETIQGVTHVIGPWPMGSATASYVENPSAPPGCGAIEAAVPDGLMAGGGLALVVPLPLR